MHGHDVGKTMGVNTWAAFAGTDEKAVVDGDFAMLESELQGVLKALRGAGINVVAIHHAHGERAAARSCSSTTGASAPSTRWRAGSAPRST